MNFLENSLLARLSLKLMRAYITGFALKLLFKLYRMIGHKKQGKILRMKNFLKNSLLHQMGNVGTIMAYNYTILYLRICANNFLFKLSIMIGLSKKTNITSLKFPENLSFWPRGKFLPDMSQNYRSLYHRIHSKDFFNFAAW